MKCDKCGDFRVAQFYEYNDNPHTYVSPRCHDCYKEFCKMSESDLDNFYTDQIKRIESIINLDSDCKYMINEEKTNMITSVLSGGSFGTWSEIFRIRSEIEVKKQDKIDAAIAKLTNEERLLL